MTFDFSRRGLLAAIGLSSVPATAAVALATAPAVIGESVEFLAFSPKIEAAMERVSLARNARKAAREEYDRLCPPIPEEIIAPDDKRREWVAFCADETDVDGKNVYPPAIIGADGKRHGVMQRRIVQAEDLRDYLAGQNPRTKRARELKKILAVAERHEAEAQAAVASTRIKEITEALDAAENDLNFLGWSLYPLEAATAAGLNLKARCAVMISGSRDHFNRNVGIHVAMSLAQDLIRIGALGS